MTAPGAPSIRDIQRAAARRHRVSLNEMLSPRRDLEVAFARQIAMYLSRKLTQRGLPTIGKHFNRDHTTVLHATRRVQALVDSRDNFVGDEIASLITELSGGSFWASRGKPDFDELDASLNFIGFELAIVPIGSRDENGFCLNKPQ